MLGPIDAWMMLSGMIICCMTNAAILFCCICSWRACCYCMLPPKAFVGWKPVKVAVVPGVNMGVVETFELSPKAGRTGLVPAPKVGVTGLNKVVAYGINEVPMVVLPTPKVGVVVVVMGLRPPPKLIPHYGVEFYC